MKKTLLLSLLYAGALIFYGCADDYFTTDNQYALKSEIDAAKANFETNATDLREIDFMLSLGKKSTKSLSKAIIVPLWDKFAIFKENGMTFFEIPLKVTTRNYATTKLILRKENEPKNILTSLLQ